MGHVPTRPFSVFRQGLDLPRRQYRGSRPTGDSALRGLSTGDLGEFLACRFLTAQGLRIIARNVTVAGGEVDIVASDHGTPVVVEVRTLTGSSHPLEAIDGQKRARVRRLAQALGIARCDLVGVGLHDMHFLVHWDLNAF